MMIYKVFRPGEWAELRAHGSTKGAPVDLADGYVHFSTATQLTETLSKHFAMEQDLVLLAFDAERLGDDLRWEPSRGGALFPHLYRPLTLNDVGWMRTINRGPEGHDPGPLE